ncbi:MULTISPECIES: amidohydrolase family protein [Streptomyces]|uniref:Amidohydrolase family protein n=1 Tax=Streptomyces eurythermus TaxID=42237 RepID=A0ABW6YPH2_9ACTN|nr:MULTISPECIES: amidohydrolase family protein [Streptomyces]QIS74690.1 amidohydrolase family protein [Streptomyces sp. DSM 40868]WDM10719.1 amidohydrolase family protein [Streptomyces lavenduligriseus]
MRTRIRGARLFDGAHLRGITDVVVEDGIVAAVGTEAGGRADAEVDGRGGTLLPGLIDAHTHVFDGSLAEALRYGVTTEIDMFCLPRPLARHRRLAADRDDVADLRSAGTIATAPGGHPTQLIAALTGSVLDPGDVTEIDTVTGPARAPAFVEARIAEGADFLKIVIDDGTVHGTDLPAMTPETAAALTAAAHDAGLRVVAHAITAAEAAVALDAGVDGLAHVWADVPPEDPASRRLARRVREQGVFVVTTLAYFEAIDVRQPGTAGCAHPGHYANAVGALRALHRAGVPLLAGTDATPFAPAHGAGLHRELALLTGAGGLRAEEALAAATSAVADRFGLGDRGRVAPGLRADLLLVDGDPTRDVSALENVTAVWRRGVRQPR